jgi:hypothetical protein
MVRSRRQAVKVRLGSSARPGHVGYLSKCLSRCLGQDTPLFRRTLGTLRKEPKGDCPAQPFPVPLLIELTRDSLGRHVITNEFHRVRSACPEHMRAARVTAHGTSNALHGGALRIGRVPVRGRDTQSGAGKAAQIGITTR